ncbi:hypothetical protein [Modestobacter roseus]|uniref:Uncharacterized protein n=1 Tax=Modestobacter roseus TaxID=1181884 RepID=A0A562IU46_9ACTN|nr:hypothetical protein [Modestobacter roseus]MQA33006.1 hypothetical protein [Modestobacter roseus]TWH74537.1 hypothetical protein JD78_03078 [Modestobacter roseus]
MTDGQAPEPVGLPTLVAWRRTGLVLCGTAVACLAGFVTALLAGAVREDSLWVLLGIGAFACGLLGLGFLRRAWYDPEVADDAPAVRARRLSSVVLGAYGTALVPNAVFAGWPGLADDLGWLRTASAALGLVAVGTFIAMLVLAARWHPGRH